MAFDVFSGGSKASDERQGAGDNSWLSRGFIMPITQSAPFNIGSGEAKSNTPALADTISAATNAVKENPLLFFGIIAAAVFGFLLWRRYG